MFRAPNFAAGARPGSVFSSDLHSRVAACALFALSIGIGAGCDTPARQSGESAGDEREEAVFVELARVEAAPLSLEVSLTGQLEAEYEVLVRSEVEGVIRSIEFDEGRPVEQRQVLFRLRDEEQRARLHEAQAAERLARDIFERTQTLTSRDISSMARHTEAAAKLDQTRAQVELAQVDLDRTRIRAPFDGVAGSLFVGPGEWVKPETGLVSIEAIEKLQILIAIPEPSIALAHIGGKIHIRVVAYPEERFAGEVFFISPSVDRATRRLIAKAWIPNTGNRLKPGMFANVDVLVFEKEWALTVPEASIVYDRNGTYVWRVDADDRAEKVPVEMGIRQAGRVEILAGLAERDLVIAAGVNKVMAGNLVEAVVPVDVQPASSDEEGAAIHARDLGGGKGDGVEG
ncbi:MAG: efflux RND transporter periplasmic adaptor subunit [Deltaproteobacteria bacterium]|nr:efflux RND transporter periplasmic adaptor subunit [Deltaproteobacteria bacterium]